MKRGAIDHPKLEVLAVELGTSKAAAVGHFEALLHFAAKYAPRGDLEKWPAKVIASRCFWDGEPGVFVCALVSAKLCDERDNQLFLHDWHEHADDAVNVYLARSGLTFANGAAPNTRRLSKEERTQIAERTKSARRAHGKRTESASNAHRKRFESAPALPSPKEDKEEKQLPDDVFISELKANPAYSHIDVDRELGKMDAWLRTHRGRQKTRRFVVNWLNKIEQPLPAEKSAERPFVC